LLLERLKESGSVWAPGIIHHLTLNIDYEKYTNARRYANTFC